jgi:zinc/manganese transport system substrate-binding protein
MIAPRTPRRTQRRLAVIAGTSLLLAACGSEGTSSSSDSSQPPESADAPLVVATTSIWADITTNVACDGLADVRMIIPPGGDPHSFEPSLRDRETMDNADLIVANGLFLEESLEDTIDAVEAGGVPVLRVGDDLDPIPTNADAHDDHDHGDEDPHVWWDPTRIAMAVPLIADALVAAGLDRDRVDVCADQYVDDLTRLDEELTTLVATLPADRRLLVTNHDSLRYFADHYGFEVLGSVIPSSSSLAATSPADLDALAADIEATGVSAIFADAQNSSDDADALANRIGDVEVISMLTGTLDEPGTDQGTYLGWLRQNVETIVEALGGAS